ncbi:hypothetical protein MHYP_G00174320 [Metynnis hypsauchen]
MNAYKANSSKVIAGRQTRELGSSLSACEGQRSAVNRSRQRQTELKPEQDKRSSGSSAPFKRRYNDAHETQVSVGSGEKGVNITATTSSGGEKSTSPPKKDDAERRVAQNTNPAQRAQRARAASA